MRSSTPRSPQPRATPEQLRRSWVAARLAGVGVQSVAKWCAGQGLPAASQTTFERAVGPVRADAPLKGKRGRPGTRAPKARPTMMDWLLVDEAALGVKKMIYRVANNGMRQGELIEAVRRLVGVRQVLETGSDRELIIVALVRDESQARLLRNALERLAAGRAVKMDPVEFEDQQPAVRTWQALAEEH